MKTVIFASVAALAGSASATTVLVDESLLGNYSVSGGVTVAGTGDSLTFTEFQGKPYELQTSNITIGGYTTELPTLPPPPVVPETKLTLLAGQYGNAPVTQINVVDAYAHFGNSYKEVLSKETGVPVADIPNLPTRLGFGQTIDYGYQTYDVTSYSLNTIAPSLTNESITFKAVWDANGDLPYESAWSTAGALIDGVVGTYKVPGNNASFTLMSSDSLGPAAQLTVYDVVYSADVNDGSYSISSSESLYSYHFYASQVPEPANVVLMLAGLAAFGVSAKRKRFS